MNNLPSLFTPARARPEPSAPAPAPERRAAVEPNGTDFARSLASVRGLQRAAAVEERNQTRAALRSDDRSDARDARANDPTSVVRSRAQVQALMLSGAMKFAASRGADAAVTVPRTPAPSTDTPNAAAPEQAVTDTSLLAASEVPADMAPAALARASSTAAAMPEMLASTKMATWVPPTDITSDERVECTTISSIPATMPELTTSAAATLAALQLVATLPIADAPVAVASEQDQPTPSTDSNNDDAARAAWTRGMAAQQSNDAGAMLLEDHFDAPAISAIAAIAPVRATTSSAALQSIVPANVTLTFADAAAGANTPTSASAPIATTTATPVSARSDVHAIERDVEQLSPEFRARLQRVMDRMKQEFGHDVTVVETVRSTARQAALFAQGRTAPGPVVTWTRNSKHSQGLAADLMVDGQWDNPVGYARLQQIAQQEGLRTLGARDPGHLELAGDGSGVSAETLGTLLGDLVGDAGDTARKVRADVDTSGREQHANAMARVADVAQVARVSQVAQVARVATVARPGAAPARGEQGAGENISPLAMTAPMPQFIADGVAAARATAPTSQVNMADRISHLMDLQASQSAKPLNSVLLRMDNANGIEDQIRIDTRGTSVDAQLGLGTAQQAAELNGRVNELREALERRGLTAEGVRVQAAPRATDSVQFSRMSATALDVATMRAASEGQAQGNTRDQASRDQQQREAMAREQERPTPRSSSDDARHRSRREQPETRQ